MLLKIYATGAPHGSRAGGPSLIVGWRYTATVSSDDAMFAGQRDAVAMALTNRGFYASRRVLGVGAAHPHVPVERHRRVTDRLPMSYQRRLAERAFASA